MSELENTSFLICHSEPILFQAHLQISEELPGDALVLETANEIIRIPDQAGLTSEPISCPPDFGIFTLLPGLGSYTPAFIRDISRSNFHAGSVNAPPSGPHRIQQLCPIPASRNSSKVFLYRSDEQDSESSVHLY